MKKFDYINDLLLRKRLAVTLKTVVDKKQVKEKHIIALLSDISQLGYTLSKEIIDVLKTYDKKHLGYFHDTLIKSLAKMLGSNFKYVPLFKNFPDDVPDEYEYLFDRINGYVENLFGILPENKHVTLSCGHVIDENVFDMSKFGACPICQHQANETDDYTSSARPKLKEITPLKVIELVDKSEIYFILRNLLVSPVALSEEDYADINLILSNGKDDKLKESIPDITNKEILSKFLASLIFYFDEKEVISLMESRKLTATDILRLAVAFSNGDVSLSNFYTKFKSFKNKERRLLLGFLDKVEFPLENMKRYAEEWKRLGERLHPGQYSNKYPNAFNAFKIIRNDAKGVKTFLSSVEIALEKKDFLGAAKLLENRPGEFIRRLDFLLRNSKDVEPILNIFRNIVGDIKTLTLLQVKTYFSHRNEKSDIRYFMPKGNMAKIKIFDDSSDIVKKYSVQKKETISSVVSIIESEIIKRYSEKDKLKNVFIDPALKECLIPSVRRNAMKSLNSVARGTKLSIGNPDARTLRLFIYWKGDVDLDLSVLCYDKNWKLTSKVSFRDLADKERGILHSGDIQSAPNGASEFIDIDIDKARTSDIRYVVMTVLSFSGEDFSTFESFAGAMKRSEPGSGEIYEPKTVQDRFEFDGEGRIAVPLVYDLVEEKLTYTELVLKGNSGDTIECSSSNLKLMAKTIIDFERTKPNLFDLFSLHAKARGANIDYEFDSEKEYDVIFGIDKGITPYQIDIINGEWID